MSQTWSTQITWPCLLTHEMACRPCSQVCPPTAGCLGCQSSMRRPKARQSFHLVPVYNLQPSILYPISPLLSLSPIFSTWEASFRMTVVPIWRQTPGSAKPHKPLVVSVSFSGTRNRSTLHPTSTFSTLSLFQLCSMVQNVLRCCSNMHTGCTASLCTVYR